MRTLLSVFLLAVACLGFAQVLDAQRDAIYLQTFGASYGIKGGFIDVHWMEDGNSFWWGEGEAGARVFYKFDPVAGKKSEVFDVQRVRDSLKEAGGPVPAAPGLPFSAFTFAPGEKAVTYRLANFEVTLDLVTYKTTAQRLPPEPQPGRPLAGGRRPVPPRLIHEGLLTGTPPTYEKPAPNGQMILGANSGNLYLRPLRDDFGGPPLTTDGTPEFGWEVDDATWSPDGRYIYACKVDRRNVPLYPIARWLGEVEKVDYVRLERVDQPTADTQPHIFVNRKPVRIKAPGFIALRWSADSKKLYGLSYGFKSIDLVEIEPTTGDARRLLTDTTKTFFDLGVATPGNFTPLATSPQFLWLSERDGWNQIYLYGFDGKLIRQLTGEKRPVVKVIAVDEREGCVYYTAHAGGARPYDFHLYRCKLSGGPSEQLTGATGQHDGPIYLSSIGFDMKESIRFSPSLRFFLDAHSNVDRPGRTDLRRADGSLVATISTANADSMKPVQPHFPEEFTAKAADGTTDLYGVVYKPYNFDPAKKYPVIDGIYAGPQTTWVSRTYAGTTGNMDQAVANLGFIVYAVDARGTPDRGKAFQDVVYMNFGRNEIADHVAVLKQLGASRPYIDLSRVGVFGGSFGGYFTIRAMLQAPDVFKVGVSMAPATDLRCLTPGMAAYVGQPDENKAVYDYASNLPIAWNLKGKLLIVHGTSDVNAPLTGTMQMIEAFVRAGKPYDLILLPDQTHGPTGASLMYYVHALKNYFVEHLKP